MKKKIMHVLMLIFVLVFTASAYGRIGETEAEVTKRFGSGQKISREDTLIPDLPPRGYEVKIYSKEPYFVYVYFFKGVSQKEIYHSIFGMAQRDVDAFMSNNALGGRWIRDKDQKQKFTGKPFHYWHTDGGKWQLEAVTYEEGYHSLVFSVYTSDFSKVLAAENRGHNASEL